MARRMLVEKSAHAPVLPLIKKDHASEHMTAARREAMWTLVSLGQISTIDELIAVNESDYVMRAWLANAIGLHFSAFQPIKRIDDFQYPLERLGEHLALRLEALAKDPEPTVRFAVANALIIADSGQLTVSQHSEGPSLFLSGQLTLADLTRKTASEPDPLLSFAIWRSLEPHLIRRETNLKFYRHSSDWVDWLADLAPTTQPLSRVLSHKAMRRLCDTREAENLDLAVEFCDKIAAHEILLAHALDGLVKGQESGVIKPVKDVSASLTKWRSSANADVRKHAQTLAVLWGDEAAVKEMISALNDASKPEKDRIAVLQSLRKVKTDAVQEGLKPLLAPSTSTTLGVAAIRAAADLGGDDFIVPLIKQAASKDANIRVAALEALSSRTTWTKAMLEAIAEGQVGASGFPAPVRRALATSKDKALRDLAFKVLGAWQDSSEDVKSLIAAKKQACLTGEPDLANGKLIFTGTCMVCHEFHGGGQKVGPDLIGSGRSNLDAILANVIDPNQIIGNGYENFTVSTKDGRTLAGRVVEDTPSHVKLLGAGGASQIVPRDQIATLTNTKQSLMPMGFGALPDAMFRDLIWYILAPPEEGPLTKAKKDLLIKGVETGEPAKPKGTNWRAIDWESVSLWNPDWKVSAPDFERTPVKFAEYHGKTNVLMMHPFPDKKTPASLERKVKIQAGKTKLKFNVAADDRGDWKLKVMANGQEIKTLIVDHEKPRWKSVEIDLAKFEGQEITLNLEAHANGWNMEFAYWQGITLE